VTCKVVEDATPNTIIVYTAGKAQGSLMPVPREVTQRLPAAGSTERADRGRLSERERRPEIGRPMTSSAGDAATPRDRRRGGIARLDGRIAMPTIDL